VAPASPWARIKEHKIIQWALGYLAAALALAHAEELIAHAFDWPEFVSRALIVVLALGLPVAITLAWYHGHRASRHVTGAEATIIAILLLIGGGFLWLFVRPHEAAVTQSVAERGRATTSPVPPAAVPLTPASTVPNSGKPRIAVLPFENLSPDPANAFFTDGLHEEIISTLSSRAPDLEVISRTTMMTYRTPRPAPEIARELGATHVLEGSVRREGSVVRLTLQLINARSDQHVWSQDYDRTLTSALTLQSEVANEVATQLAVRLSTRARSFTPLTRDPQAYDLFLRARLETDSFRGPNTPLEALQKVEHLLDDALARDPDFARAYAQRALMRVLKFAYNYDTPQHAMPLAEKDLEVAERLAPDDPEVLFVKATFLDYLQRDPAAAVATLEAAGADGLDPRYLAASAQVFNSVGRFDEATRRTQRALALDPKNNRVYAQLMVGLFFTRRPVEALHVADLASAEFPEFRSWRNYVIWAHTATGPPTATPIAVPVAEITANVDVRAVDEFLFPLRIEHRYREMLDYLGRAQSRTIRGWLTSGHYHVAALRGWAHLLLGDHAAAAQDGREVLDFVTHSEETQWNRAGLTILTAEGYTFTGDKTRAITAAAKALRLSQSLYDRQTVPQLAASVYAWSGAADDAASLLEKLSTQIPMVLELGPATIARDPLYTVPLANNARYKALQARLEAQMAATKFE
jgi:TolB-like protein